MADCATGESAGAGLPDVAQRSPYCEFASARTQSETHPSLRRRMCRWWIVGGRKEDLRGARGNVAWPLELTTASTERHVQNGTLNLPWAIVQILFPTHRMSTSCKWRSTGVFPIRRSHAGDPVRRFGRWCLRATEAQKFFSTPNRLRINCQT